ncbi:hypothetical protein E2562_029641 [Oryza meyeriana var. granulata]|uniref:Uncharacterized protein n=1 Tax=Oryza meyeriana var. granulata TaxID=110450 RepID=A0A6G1FE18_9ORYZ|nr:hypothetical protein E2562_029641 [Oryza meyeriana var. granulata]
MLTSASASDLPNFSMHFKVCKQRWEKWDEEQWRGPRVDGIPLAKMEDDRWPRIPVPTTEDDWRLGM